MVGAQMVFEMTCSIVASLARHNDNILAIHTLIDAIQLPRTKGLDTGERHVDKVTGWPKEA